MMFGQITNPKNEKLKDLNLREYATLLPLVAMAFWIGIYPKPFFRIIEKPVNQIVEKIHPASSPDLCKQLLCRQLTNRGCEANCRQGQQLASFLVDGCKELLLSNA